jgi:hypothetical protein
VQDGDDKHILRLAQGQRDIIVQRKIRDHLEAAKTEADDATKADGEVSEVALAVRQERWDDVVASAQNVADTWIYGSRPPSTGETAKTRKAVAELGNIKEAAKNNPALAEQLRALGVNLD